VRGFARLSLRFQSGTLLKEHVAHATDLVSSRGSPTSATIRPPVFDGGPPPEGRASEVTVWFRRCPPAAIEPERVPRESACLRRLLLVDDADTASLRTDLDMPPGLLVQLDNQITTIRTGRHLGFAS